MQGDNQGVLRNRKSLEDASGLGLHMTLVLPMSYLGHPVASQVLESSPVEREWEQFGCYLWHRAIQQGLDDPLQQLSADLVQERVPCGLFYTILAHPVSRPGGMPHPTDMGPVVCPYHQLLSVWSDIVIQL